MSVDRDEAQHGKFCTVLGILLPETDLTFFILLHQRISRPENLLPKKGIKAKLHSGKNILCKSKNDRKNSGGTLRQKLNLIDI